MAYTSSLSQGVTLLITLHVLHTQHKQDVVSSKFLSESIGIPLPTTVKTLKGLSIAGLIIAKEGAGGGNSLKKPISQITLLDVFMTVEQDTTLFKVHHSIPCDHTLVKDLINRLDSCFDKTAENMKANLEKITLEQIYFGKLE